MSELSLPMPTAAALRPVRLCSDDQLVRRAARGDQRAFAEIFERHHQPVYRYCRSILGNVEDAADALQSTMAAMLRGLDGETRAIALKPWLFRIAHNEALSIVRRRRPQTALDDTQPCRRASLESGVLASEQLRQLVADVQALPERQRGALVMRELNHLGYDEIAAIFGVAEGTARQAVHEARTALHELDDGRAMACADIRELISARDGRLLRARRVRAHLRACDSCAQFRAAIGQRRDALAFAAPPLGAPVAASMLSNLLGGGHGGTTAAASGAGATACTSPVAKTAALTGLTAKATAGMTIAVKTAAIAAAAATLTGGAVVAEHKIKVSQRPTTSLTAAQSTPSARTRPAGPRAATATAAKATLLPAAAANGASAQRSNHSATSYRGTGEPTASSPPGSAPGAQRAARAPEPTRRLVTQPAADRPASKTPAAARTSNPSTSRPKGTTATSGGARRPHMPARAQPTGSKPTSPPAPVTAPTTTTPVVPTAPAPQTPAGVARQPSNPSAQQTPAAGPPDLIPHSRR